MAPWLGLESTTVPGAPITAVVPEMPTLLPKSSARPPVSFGTSTCGPAHTPLLAT
jgi:hypothetical protein